MKLITLFTLFTLHTVLLFDVNAETFQPDNLAESPDIVKAGEKYITLVGTQVNVGDVAPIFKVVDGSFSPVTLDSFKGNIVFISVVPSLDTGVCSLQTKRFNEEVTNLPSNISMLTISNDLPFAQKRFCKAENIDKIKTLSDSVWRDFGYKYGLLIKDMGLLTRAIFIIDEQGKVAYKELVANISDHPDYTMALAALHSLLPIENKEGQQETSPLPEKTDETESTEINEPEVETVIDLDNDNQKQKQ